MILMTAWLACAPTDDSAPFVRDNQAPLASVLIPRQADVGTDIVADATNSVDPDGDPIAYAWTFAVPEGSKAVLADPHGPTPSFQPDVAGPYTLTLVLDDGRDTSLPMRRVLRALAPPVPPENRPPVIAVDDTMLDVTVGEPVTLVAATADFENRPLEIRWLLDRPAQSNASLFRTRGSQTQVWADVPGGYRVTVKVGDGENVVEQTIDITASLASNVLPYGVVDAAYSTSLDRVVTVSTNPSQLHILDPVALTEQVVTLGFAPTSVSVSPDGHTAAVGHSRQLTIVDLDKAVVDQTFGISIDVHDVLLAANGFAYAIRATPSGTASLLAIDLITQKETGHTGNPDALVAGDDIWLDADRDIVLTMTGGYGSAVIHRFDISGGTAQFVRETPNANGFPVCAALHRTNTHALGECGALYRLTDDATTDLTYNGSLSGLERLLAADHRDDTVVVIPAEEFSDEFPETATLRFYDDAHYALLGSRALPRRTWNRTQELRYGRFAFWRASTDDVVVLSVPRESSNIQPRWDVVVVPGITD